MSLAAQNLKNRELRGKLEKIVQEECAKANVEPKNIYNIFVGLRNTGEQIKLPDTNSQVYHEIIRRFSKDANRHLIWASHRNIHI